MECLYECEVVAPIADRWNFEATYDLKEFQLKCYLVGPIWQMKPNSKRHLFARISKPSNHFVLYGTVGTSVHKNHSNNKFWDPYKLFPCVLYMHSEGNNGPSSEI